MAEGDGEKKNGQDGGASDAAKATNKRRWVQHRDISLRGRDLTLNWVLITQAGESQGSVPCAVDTLKPRLSTVGPCHT